MINESKRWPESFPDRWASEWGEDEHGLWMAFHFQELRHVLRWIEPGSFMMGSPEDEPERFDDETLHQVTLSEGFWLGATTVTQALWQAVMQENPSNFKGDERPVEQIIWEDVQKFMDQLNTAIPGLELVLPSEAQWEYACRAGTTTPFFFGENITTDQVNYDGNYPYAGGEKGEYRQETVDVKALPCNDWGLYQMHGNVWEWCRDWFGDYPTDPVIDPVGPPDGRNRVCRGGSWDDRARYCRSALRYGREPDDRDDWLGFRLARGRTGKQ
ncbi:Formylglycine-generating enzyme, required for sulfatase activity, contains SUMF1/FGE domain [Candidatus Electrothrix marina]|uniref:Formylglycine-generating enzyme, required for sulfatase activity, contains SUMF1/FGE domain n=1 Tax=Candidatus Electrothrix marina TaxID=1859130 RepID=A0A444J208_9BACT|nr:Formylglycine-generating enzyme, required for sulfatase activity, contains SUMF1/FGE domain [Candidatus Electrothrix marina]